MVLRCKCLTGALSEILQHLEGAGQWLTPESCIRVLQVGSQLFSAPNAFSRPVHDSLLLQASAETALCRCCPCKVSPAGIYLNSRPCATRQAGGCSEAEGSCIDLDHLLTSRGLSQVISLAAAC